VLLFYRETISKIENPGLSRCSKKRESKATMSAQDVPRATRCNPDEAGLLEKFSEDKTFEDLY
jgi:hypothetical protein